VVEIRKSQSIKLPDSIIAGTSVFLEMPLFTADKDYKRIPNLDLLLYVPE
jgi:predicted nucleic acid-binding protein